ncbi:uncharacterized protein F4822DRAFT_389075 [Hypoxylon trugodes]|uniref:uncharacterized protein n=1 Tax=Hypoxylon trugodes TaxID=326681 RepID=UPI002196CA50|nr:uncharacterized protein F4822DRAFT_389075 [Hypoxylon trugodes]KAI1391964.1 hypothetical protein F4822DRAFT_389075 [Hypoxylon trugodes]
MVKCRGAVTTISLLVGIISSVIAGDLVEDIRRDFQLGLFGRQQTVTNLQRFTAPPLGNQAAAQIVQNNDFDSKEKPFKIVGGLRSDGQTFSSFQDATNRVCDDQKNDCADFSNSGAGSFKVSECDQQDNDCKDANQPTDQDDNFLYFCDN